MHVAITDIIPTSDTMAELMAIMEDSDEPGLDQEYSAHPMEVLTFVEACRRLGRAHADHSPDERDLQAVSNQLESNIGLPRPVSHIIRRHCHA